MSRRALLATLVLAGAPGLAPLRAPAGEGNAPPPRAAAGEAIPLLPAGPAAVRDPQEVKLAYYIDEGFFETSIKNYEAAVAAFRKALEISPHHPKALFGMGTAMISSAREREAEEVLRQASRIHPKDYMIQNNLAWLYATARDPSVRNGQAAVAVGRQALILNPSDFHVWSTMAEAYYVSGDYERALRFANEALRMARMSGQPSQVMDEYRLQVQRCGDAAQALRILE